MTITEFDSETFRAGQLRADLAEIALRHCFNHGSDVIDEILTDYDVVRKKEKK